MQHGYKHALTIKTDKIRRSGGGGDSGQSGKWAVGGCSSSAMPLFHLPRPYAWPPALVVFVVLCSSVWCVVCGVVVRTTERRPFLTAVDPFYPYLAVLRVQSDSRTGAKLACHTSFISWLCGLLYGFRTQTELSARGFIEGFLGGIDSVVWCGWLIVFIGRTLVHH